MEDLKKQNREVNEANQVDQLSQGDLDSVSAGTDSPAETISETMSLNYGTIHWTYTASNP